MKNWEKKSTPPNVNRFSEELHEVRQNKILDKTLGGTLNICSGAKSGYKGDRELDGNLKIEQKATDANSISLTVKFFEKIDKEARDQGKCPAIAFSFLKYKGLAPKDWIAIPVSMFKEMYDFCKDNDFSF